MLLVFSIWTISSYLACDYAKLKRDSNMAESSDQDELRTDRNYLSKDQHTYGVFTQAFDERPSFAKGPSKKTRPHTSFVNFKAGQKIQTYTDKVEVTLLQPRSNPKSVKFSDKPIILGTQTHSQDDHSQQLFTLESLLSTLSNNQQQQHMQQQGLEEQKEAIEQPVIGFTEKTKSILKLRRFGDHKEYTLADYGLPETFGKRKLQGPKVVKSSQQMQKEKFFASRYGIGFRILSKTGFKALKGLGKEEHGILEPVESNNKQTLTAEDDLEVPPAQEELEQPQDVVEEQKEDRSMLQLFDYFSEDPAINKVLKELRDSYQELETTATREQQVIDKLTSETQVAESQILQHESQLQMEKQKLKQLSELKANMFEVHPHLALMFNIDLLIVKSTIERIKDESPGNLVNCKSVLREIKTASRRLQRIYLEKERQTIRQFSENNLNNFLNIGNNTSLYQDIKSISPEDANRIKRFQKLMFQESLLRAFQVQLNGLQLCDDAHVNTCIEVFEGLGKIDKTLQQKYLDQYVYPRIDYYLRTYKPNYILPHMVVFPWLTVISHTKINYHEFVINLHGLEWDVEGVLMLNTITPWKKYMDPKSWSSLVCLSVAPRLLYLLGDFTVSASNQNSKNMLRLKALIKYSEIMSDQQVQAIIQDSVLPAVQAAFTEMKFVEDPLKLERWLSNWNSTLAKIKPALDFTQFFRELTVK